MSASSAIFVSVGVCILAATLEGVCAGKNVKAYFATLQWPAYSAPLGVWYIIGGLYYLLWGKNHYNGPIIMGSEDDMRKLEADVEKGSIYHEPAITEPAPTLTPQRV